MAEKWVLKGSYSAMCSCKLLCPCPVDGDPTGPNGNCVGSSVFNIEQGNLGSVDLSGINFAWYYWAPGHFTGGGIRMGIIIDERATDEQTKALEGILSGKEGGVWAQFTPLVDEWVGTQRGKVTYVKGDNPRASVEGHTEMNIELFKSPDGAATTVTQSQQHWRPKYQVGRAVNSRSDSFGITYEPIYGEYAEFSFKGE